MTATECCDGRQACLVVQGVQGHYLLGLRILHMLVAEFNQPTSGRTMTMHRKLAVAFRDSSLFKIFQVAIAAMQQLQGSHDDKLREQVRPLFAQQHHWTCSVADCCSVCVAPANWKALVILSHASAPAAYAGMPAGQ